MTLGRHLVVPLVALAMAGFAAGCGGDGDNSGEVMRATLTGDGCRYQGDTTPAPPLFTIEVRNESSERAAFHLIEVPAGTTLNDVESWLEETRQRHEQFRVTTTSRGLPRRLSNPTRPASFPETHRRDVSPSSVRAARCIFSDASNPRFLTGITAAAELEVTP